MSNFYNYVLDNYSIGGVAARFLDNIVLYANENFDSMNEKADFIMEIVGDNIGMDRSEIIDNWIE